VDNGQYFKKDDAMSIHVKKLMRHLFIAVLALQLWLLFFLFWKIAKLAIISKPFKPPHMTF